jgi:hypothetical protein
MSELKTNKISPQTGTTITLGESGQIIELASGATSSGFDGILKSATDPAIDTNPASGLGTVFLNTTTGEMYSLTDATVGANVWTNIGEGLGDVQPFLNATGGTVTIDGDYKVHTFTSSGTFTPDIAGQVEYLVLAGGGGGGQNYYGGGGGGGGYQTATSFAVTSSAMTVTVGGGGQVNVNGQNSVFGSITSTGGGAGGTSGSSIGKNGGSGGGGNANGNIGGTGIVGQGFGGGTASAGGAAGSGGGAGGAAANNVGNNVSQVGGIGLSSDITGTAVVRGEGGTGGSYSPSGIPVAGAGRGSIYEAVANVTYDVNATAGEPNRGGGGGGSGNGTDTTTGLGGSGIVIIRYQFQ